MSYPSSSRHTRKGVAEKREGRSESRFAVSDTAERKDSSRSTSTRAGATEQIPVVLSKTEGLAAVSAWKAREELASLLEKRADPGTVVSAIRAGVEGVPFYEKEEKSPPVIQLLQAQKGRVSRQGARALGAGAPGGNVARI